MQIPNLEKATIQENTAGGSYERGEKYAEEDRVRSIRQIGEHEVEARVKGQQYLPYTVHIEFDEEGITEVECTCPYHAGTWCKHVAATLIVAVDGSVPKATRPSVADLVGDLDREELVELITRLAEYDPDLVDQIKAERTRLDESKEV